MRDYPPMTEYKAVSARLQDLSAVRVAAVSGHCADVIRWVKGQTRMVTVIQLRDIRQALDKLEAK